MKIIVAINYVNYKNASKRKWQDVALSVLVNNRPNNVMLASFNYEDEEVNVSPSFQNFKMLKRHSKDIGNNRDLPYIKEILDDCSKLPCEVFGYINSDILVDKKFFKLFRNGIDAYVFSRIDIHDISAKDFLDGKSKVNEAFYSKGKHDGADGFFFRKKWWLKNRNKFHDDLILGEPYFDHYYRKVMYNNSDKVLLKHSLKHVYHTTTWSFDSKGALNNTRIWAALND